MTTIGAVGGRPGIRPGAPTGSRAASGFLVPESGVTDSQAAQPASGAGAVGHVSLDAMLAAEALDQDARRNATARRQGHAVLRGLGALQQTLLDGGDPRAALVELARLVSDLPPASDPRLAAVLDSIALRARVELARHGAGVATSPPSK